MRLYITGCVGSGKSTLARRLGAASGVPYTHLDEIMYRPDPSSPLGNTKRDPAARDSMFKSIISQKNWIIEDAGRECFKEGISSSDKLILLKLPRRTLYRRVIFRWVKQRLGIEKSIYKPTFVMLRSMLQWVREYDITHLLPYARKIVILKSVREIDFFIKENSSPS